MLITVNHIRDGKTFPIVTPYDPQYQKKNVPLDMFAQIDSDQSAHSRSPI